MLLSKQQHYDYLSQNLNKLRTFKVMIWIKVQLEKYY